MDIKQIQVLLLEDEAAHIEAIRRALESAANLFNVQVVTSIKKYHQLIEVNPPDIALLDMVLPDGNALDLLSSAQQPVVFPMLILTSHGNEQAAVAALKKGALDYIVKSPETFANMPRIVTSALKQWASIQEVKKAERALQISEESFRNSIENSPLGIRIVREDGETLYTNHAFLDIYGYKNIEEFKMTPVNERYAPESYLEFHERREKRQRRQPLPDNYDVTIVRKDGGERYLHVVRKEIMWAGNKQYQTIYQDITEQKRVEEALKESEVKYRLIVEKSNDILFTFNSAGVLLYISPSVKTLLGYNQTDLIGHNFGAIVHPDDMSELQQAIQRNVKDGSQAPGGNRYRIRHASGKWCWHNASGNAVHDENGKFLYFIGITRDITPRVQAEEALKASEEKYSTLVEQSTDGILILVDRRVVFANQKVKEMTGLSDREILGKAFYELTAPEYKEMLDEIYRKRQSGVELSINHELEILNIDGKKIAVETKLQPIDYKGMKAGMVIIHDISERKKAEEIIKESERNFRNSLDGSLMGIRIMGDADSTLYANQTLLDMFGYKNIDDLRTNPPQEHYTPESYAGFIRRKEQFSRGVPLPDELDVDILRKDGAIRHLHMVSSAIIWNGKQQQQFLFNDITERVEAGKALKLSEQNFRKSLDNSPMGVRVVDAGWKTLYVNQKFLNIIGYKRADDISSHPLHDHYSPEETMRAQQRDAKRLRGEPVPADMEVEIMPNGGGVRYLHVYLTETLWNGKPQRQLVYDDITERKLAEKKLTVSEQNFRNSLDSSPMGIRIVDSERNTLYANKEFLKIFGYKNVAEIGIYPLQDRYTPEENARFLLRKERRLSGEALQKNIKVEILSMDGSIRYLEVYGSEILWDDKLQLELIYKDVTESTQAEKALQESEEKYRMIVENTRDMIFTINDKEVFVYVSPSVKDMLGYNETELIGKTFISLVHPEDVPIIQEEIQHSLQPGYKVSSDNEYRMRHASGEWHWVVSRGTRVFDKNGKFLHFSGIARDITEHKQSEAEKLQIEEKAQISARLAAIGEMAAGIAHEINNPLTSVLGFSQIVLEKEDVPEDVKDNLKLIADGSQRVAEIVRRLLVFARQAKPFKTSVNINEIIGNTLKLREYVLKTNNIEVITKFDPELPWISVDPSQMQQVFLNLIVNAEQAMKKAHGRGILTITTEKKLNNIRISVQDDGPGISKENMRHLFEPFFTTKDPGEGTGLGLSISRSIIMEHNGTINVESELRHGATFVIELPITENSPVETETTNPLTLSQPSVKKDARILVIDDEPSIRQLLEKSLSRAGYSVDVITDASSTVEIIDAHTIYDVIISDIRMPGMNGLELYTHIVRKMPAMANRIIFITGDVMGADIKAFISSNKIPYLAKPFKLKALEEMIDNILASN